MKRCRHEWLNIVVDVKKGHFVGDWYWCCLCGATKHVVYDAKYYELSDRGIYIREVGRDKKTKLVDKW
jgi:hypothetical protein